jgi:hypothetical protein
MCEAISAAVKALAETFFGDRPTAGQQTLTLLIKVRILVPEPDLDAKLKIESYGPIV